MELFIGRFICVSSSTLRLHVAIFDKLSLKFSKGSLFLFVKYICKLSPNPSAVLSLLLWLGDVTCILKIGSVFGKVTNSLLQFFKNLRCSSPPSVFPSAWCTLSSVNGPPDFFSHLFKHVQAQAFLIRLLPVPPHPLVPDTSLSPSGKRKVGNLLLHMRHRLLELALISLHSNKLGTVELA